jgi:hypothetical protein
MFGATHLAGELRASGGRSSSAGCCSTLGLTLPRARPSAGFAGLLNFCLMPQAGRWGPLAGEAPGDGSPRGSLPPLTGRMCLDVLPMLVADRRMLLRALLCALPGALLPATPGLCMPPMSSLGTARLAPGLGRVLVPLPGLSSWEVLTEEVRLRPPPMAPAGTHRQQLQRA